MKTKEFVYKLKNAIFNEDTYKKAGYSDNYIKKLKKYYSFEEKTGIYKKNNDPILELLENYIVTGVNFCFTSFYEQYEVKGQYIYFGSLDADILAINTENEEIVLIDSQSNEDYVMLSCAVSSPHFLGALAEAASFNVKKAMDERLEDTEIVLEKAKEISAIAGGIKYLQFSKLLFGI